MPIIIDADTPDRTGIKLTALKRNDLPAFEDHYRRFLSHTDLLALDWVNINPLGSHLPHATAQASLTEKRGDIKMMRNWAAALT